MRIGLVSRFLLVLFLPALAFLPSLVCAVLALYLEGGHIDGSVVVEDLLGDQVCALSLLRHMSSAKVGKNDQNFRAPPVLLSTYSFCSSCSVR